MLRFFKILGISVAFIVVLILSALLILWSFPSLLVNEQNLSWLQKRMEKEGYDLDWRKLQVAASSSSFFDKEIFLELEELRYASPDRKVEIESPLVKIRVGLGLSGFAIERLTLHEISVQQLRARVTSEQTAQAPQLPSLDFPLWRSTLEKIEIGEFDFSLAKFQVGEGTNASSFSGKMFSTQELLKLDFDLRSASGTSESSSQLRAELPLVARQLRLEGMQIFLKSVIGDQTRLSCEIRSETRVPGETLQLRLNGGFQTQDFRLEFQDTLELGSSNISGELSGDIYRPASQKNELIQIKPLTYQIDWAGSQINFEFEAAWKKVLSLALVERLTSENIEYVSGSLSADGRFSLEDSFTKAQLSISLDPVVTKTIDLGLSAKLELDGRLEELQRLVGVGAKVDFDLVSKDFRVLNQLLVEFGAFIPAPLNVLEGEMRLSMKSEFDMSQRTIPAEFELKTDLSSTNQNIGLSLGGKLMFEKAKKMGVRSIDANLILNDVLLVAPPLGMKPPPRLLPDPRITSENPVAIQSEPGSEKNPFKTIFKEKIPYRLQIQTGAKALRVKNQFSNEPLAFVLPKVILSSERESEGSIRLKPGELQFFRRKAMIEKAIVQLEPKLSESEVDVVVEVPYADYRVRIRITGPVEAPAVLLESDPPMQREDIIAILLFGSPVDDLDSEDGRSATNTQAALADRGLTLLSMYYLASTPIESVGYNPETEEFRAKLKLPSGFSFTIGANSEEVSHVGIKKELGNGFQVTTQVENSDSENEPSVSTFLEWFKRY